MRFNTLSDRIGVVVTFSAYFLALFCSGGLQAAGQTKTQLAAKYTEIAAFEIRPGIVAFSTFTKDGDVCRVVIEKLLYLDQQSSNFDDKLPSALVDLLVDEVVPPSERGKRAKYLSTDSFIAGGSAYLKQDYENVSVGIYGTSAAEGPKPHECH